MRSHGFHDLKTGKHDEYMRSHVFTSETYCHYWIKGCFVLQKIITFLKNAVVVSAFQ